MPGNFRIPSANLNYFYETGIDPNFKQAIKRSAFLNFKTLFTKQTLQSMKNISLLLNVILAFLLIYFGCNGKFSCKDNQPSKQMGYCPAKGCETYNPSQKYGMISFATAKMLAENYAGSEGKKFIYDGTIKTSEQDALNIWFDLKILKNFIAFIESSACKANCDTSKRLGIRIYYGKYPDSTELANYADLADVPKKYGKHHTVFMMPTFYDSVAKKNLDFDPMQTAANCNFKPFDNAYTTSVFGISINQPMVNVHNSSQSDRLKTNGKLPQRQETKPQNPKTFFISGGTVSKAFNYGSDVEGDQQNHGGVVPPPDNTGSFPTTVN